jgi:cobalt-zinc-cadmium efflux system protein
VRPPSHAGHDHAHPHDAHVHHHADAHDHAHGHSHAPAPEAPSRSGGFTPREAHQAGRLRIVIGLISAFFVVELLGAIWADSIVLQADALHLLTDVLALGANLLAMRIAVREPTPRFTYGLRRAEPMAAMAGALLVLATTSLVLAEAVRALHERTPPKAGIMLFFAFVALLVNGCSAWLLHDAIGGHAHSHAHESPTQSAKDHGHALNLRSAWLHMAGDALGAIAAIIAGLVIRAGGPAAADAIASFLVAAILVVGSVRILFAGGLVLFEAAPPHLPVATVRAIVAGYPGVVSVRDLHVWTLGGGHDAITLHVRALSTDAAVGQRLSEHLKGTLGVEYVTVQVELAS